MPEPLMRDHEKWVESVRNFEWLRSAVSGAMDVDCMIERKGHFLIVEGKPWSNGVTLPYGQHKALYALSKQPFTRVYLVGETGGDVIHVACYNDSPAPVFVRSNRTSWWPPDRFLPTTKDLFLEMVRSWWSDASASAN